VIGQTGGNSVRIAVDGRIAIDQAVGTAERVWASAIGQYFERRVA
jgi:hypothetical protein